MFEGEQTRSYVGRVRTLESMAEVRLLLEGRTLKREIVIGRCRGLDAPQKRAGGRISRRGVPDHLKAPEREQAEGDGRAYQR
jgi:hypothetical protein